MEVTMLKSPGYFSGPHVPPGFIANFDSATAMLRANAFYLREQEFTGVGFMPRSAKPLGAIINRLPKSVKESIYIWSGFSEAIPGEDMSRVDVEEITSWVCSEYPNREYPAVMIGSSNGAAVHLNAALGIPWLPQTFLIPVQQPDVHPDDTVDGMEAGREPARLLLEANPDIQLHHMHDANQDRLMLGKMGYFRIKKRTLGPNYQTFLRKHLRPGGTIIINECHRTWPTTRMGERYIFQHGALGGATEDEFHHGSDRVEEYLERYGSHKRRWDSPTKDGETPEAEWGFEPALRDDIEQFAAQNGFNVRRITYREPEHLSPLVADLYRWWYRQRNVRANRLVAESFIVMEPYWILRTGSVPFWMKFNMEPSRQWLMKYLENTDPYDDVHVMLFSHGVEAVGLPTIDQWSEAFKYAQRNGSFLGVDESVFPRDFATLVRFQTELMKIPSRYPLPGMLTMNQLESFLEEHGDKYRVEFGELYDPSNPNSRIAA
jgi:hypothetical protein